MVGAATRSCSWAGQQLSAADARFRANVIESLWGSTSEESKELFAAAVRDANNRVAGNGIVGLYRAGSAESIRRVLEMARAEDPKFRVTAAWAMGTVEDPRFAACLRRMLSDAAPGVRGNVVRALAALRRAADGLEWLSVFSEPAGRECRRRMLQLGVFDTGSRPVGGLPETAFICSAGDDLISNYAVSCDALPRGQYLLHVEVGQAADLRIQAFRRAPSANSNSAAH
jgi:hypothetical protein